MGDVGYTSTILPSLVNKVLNNIFLPKNKVEIEAIERGREKIKMRGKGGGGGEEEERKRRVRERERNQNLENASILFQ